MGEEVADLYEQKLPVQPERSVHFSISLDGKGIPKIIATVVKEGQQRLGKREKRGVKQMAMVCVMSSFAPKIHSVESVLNGLMVTYQTLCFQHKIREY